MARIKDTTVEAVKAAADFVDVVGARTQLRKGGGGRYMGRCPFHEERTPSFSVNAVDKLYHCFGCGAKGDLISFVRETEGLDFAGAIEWLADRFRVEIEYEESSPAQDAARRGASGCSRCSTRPPRTTRARSGDRGGMACPRLPDRARPRRGDLPRVPARARARRQLARPKASAKGFTSESFAPQG